MAELVISELFNKWYLDNPTTVVALINKNNDIVGALYLDSVFKANKYIAVLKPETTAEKYYIYLDGLAIYFSNFKKIEN